MMSVGRCDVLVGVFDIVTVYVDGFDRTSRSCRINNGNGMIMMDSVGVAINVTVRVSRMVAIGRRTIANRDGGHGERVQKQVKMGDSRTVLNSFQRESILSPGAVILRPL